MIWREPSECSEGLYPHLEVQDNRVSGSILVGGTRLPVWAFAAMVVQDGWDRADHSYGIAQAGLTRAEYATFLWTLLEQRGEFARLLLILADVERRESIANDDDGEPWWRDDVQKARVVDQLQRCIDALGEPND